MDTAKVDRYVAEKWDDDIVPQLVEYIRIPNKSPMFDKDWVANGYMEQAVQLMERWRRRSRCRACRWKWCALKAARR